MFSELSRSALSSYCDDYDTTLSWRKFSCSLFSFLKFKLLALLLSVLKFCHTILSTLISVFLFILGKWTSITLFFFDYSTIHYMFNSYIS